ncbi:hypothetical protein BH23ACT5_BH23ACT5_22740 [soil metagenome]
MPAPESRLEVLCINGPNLDRLGHRDPSVYGSTTLAQLEEKMRVWGDELDIGVRCLQSSHEGDLVQALNELEGIDGIVINPGALTHTSRALHDAVESCGVPAVEIHISNVRARERWRRRSLLAPVVVASIFGRGVGGYRAALSTLSHRRRWPVEMVRYGPHPDQVVDVRRAAGEQGVAVLVHGGFWLDVWGRDIVEGWAVALAEAGISTACIEYRRLRSGGGGLATVSDAADAIGLVAWLFGTTPLVVVGHSAGAHLAVAAATRASADLSGLVGVGGIYDLETPDVSGLGGGAVAAFKAWGGASATTAAPDFPPLALLHGSDDEVVPASQSAAYAEAMTAAGHEVAFHELDGIAHFDFLDTRSPAWETTRSEVERLFTG